MFPSSLKLASRLVSFALILLFLASLAAFAPGTLAAERRQVGAADISRFKANVEAFNDTLRHERYGWDASVGESACWLRFGISDEGTWMINIQSDIGFNRSEFHWLTSKTPLSVIVAAGTVVSEGNGEIRFSVNGGEITSSPTKLLIHVPKGDIGFEISGRRLLQHGLDDDEQVTERFTAC